ncbi:MAG: MaoC family dehydratase [Dehalococcoidia bacterium]
MEHAGQETFERYLEDLRPGDRYRHWPGRTMTEAANNAFCFWTMNQQPLHLDAEYAAETQYGRRLINGLLVLSVAVGMSIRGLSGATIANLEYERVVHEAPVFIGDTVYAETTVLEVRESRTRPDRGIVQVETRVTNQSGQRVVTFTRRFMLPRRSRP